MVPQFLSARPNLGVKSVSNSLDFYCGKLGFDVRASMGDPPTFALIVRDDAEIALVEDGNATPGGCYIYVADVDWLYEQYRARGLSVTHPLTTHTYGMRDFVVADPDGHRIAFGERVGVGGHT